MVSVLISYRVGYGRAQDPVERLLYGFALALADGLKVFAPFAMAWAWGRKAWVSWGAAAGIFVLVTISSLQAEIEFASKLRSSSTAERQAAVDQRQSVQKEIDELTIGLEKLGPQRSPGEIEREIEVVFARPLPKVSARSTVRSVSQGCEQRRPSTQDACAEITRLRQELERSKDWESRTEKLTNARAKLQGLGSTGAEAADPPLETISGLVGWFTDFWGKEDVKLALLLLVALVLEIGSGLGLFVVTTPWRLGSGLREGEVIPGVISDAERIGTIEEYAQARVIMSVEHQVTCSHVFLDYRRWCEAHRLAPLREGEFLVLFDEFVRGVGVPVLESGGNIVYLEMRLGDQ